jgi:outer membrane protein TolC
MRRLLVLLLLLAAPLPLRAQPAPHPLAGHLDRAVAIDAASQALLAARRAAEARSALATGPMAGPPVLGGSLRSDTRGPGTTRELDLEIAAPLWLPGQREALRGAVAGAVAEIDRRLALRRLEVAGLLREAWWEVDAARRDLTVARDRLATARAIARDIRRRSELGDVPGQETLLGESEALAAEAGLARAEATLAAAVAAYAMLTGGAAPPATAAERAAGAGPHPAIRAAEAAVAAAEARRRLVAATPRDNPELGLFGRQDAGSLVEGGTSVGLRVRLPLASEQRNAPRRAEAEADLTRAEAELAAERRLRTAEAAAAEAALAAADRALVIARNRARLATQQSDGARRAFQSGEIGTFDLFRIRQIAIEATAAEARAVSDQGRARARLNQALGAEP